MTSFADYVRAIRGPVLLMVTGGLFFVDHRGIEPFYRTWPVLLVALGLLVLLERLPGAPQGGRS